MDRKRKLAILMATLAIAAATGHMMQSGRAAPGQAVQAGLGGRAEAAVRPAEQAPIVAVPVAHARVPMAAAEAGIRFDLPPDPAPVATVILAAAQAAQLPGPVADAGLQLEAGAAPSCAPELRLAAEPGAMIGLVLTAPCAPEARVVVRHEGLAFTARTDAAGRLALSLPALAADARVRVALPGNDWATAEVAVPEVAQWLRFGLQWMGPDRFALHAFEGEAAFGAPGHLRAGAAPGLGSLIALGTEAVERPLLAEVYSLPRAAAASEVRLLVEAPVTAATCGREMLAETLALRGGGPVEMVDLAVAMPACDSAGGFLAIPDLFDDLRLAQGQ